MGIQEYRFRRLYFYECNLPNQKNSYFVKYVFGIPDTTFYSISVVILILSFRQLKSFCFFSQCQWKSSYCIFKDCEDICMYFAPYFCLYLVKIISNLSTHIFQFYKTYLLVEVHNSFENCISIFKSAIWNVREMFWWIQLVFHTEKCKNYTTVSWIFQKVLVF